MVSVSELLGHSGSVPSPHIVVGAVIVDDLARPTRVLAARRASGAAQTVGCWEFPGGKVEPGESPTDALRRELIEELAVQVRVGAELGDRSGWPINEQLVLHLFVVQITSGVAAAGPDHDAVRWLDGADLESVPWLASDRAALPAVRRLLGLVA